MNLTQIIKSFPSDFIFGAATSSYQIEGNSFGKCGKSHWDSFARKKNSTYKNQNGSVACNHINHWEKDLDLIKNAGFKGYRFSFSWPRLLLDGK